MKQKLFSNFLLLTCITCAIAPLDLNAAAPHFTPTSPLVLKSTPADNLLKSLEALENEIGKLIRNKKDSAECVPLQEDMKMQLKYMSYVLKNIDQQSQDTIYNATGWALKYFTFILGNLEGELADPAFSILANLQQVQNTLTYISNQFQEYKAEIQKRSEDLKLMKKCKKIKNELNDLLKVFISHSIDSSKGLFCDVSQSAGVIPALYLANANNKDINGDSRLQTGLSEQIEGDLVKEMRSFISDKNLYFEDCEKEHAHFIEMLTAKKGPNHSRAYWIASGNIIENFENDLVAPAIVNFLTQCDFKDTDELLRIMLCHVAGHIYCARKWNPDQKNNAKKIELKMKEKYLSKLKNIDLKKLSDPLKGYSNQLLKSLNNYITACNLSPKNDKKKEEQTAQKVRNLLAFAHNLNSIKNEQTQLEQELNPKITFNEIFQDLDKQLEKFENSKKKLSQLKEKVDLPRIQAIEKRLNEAKSEQDFSDFINAVEELVKETEPKEKVQNDIEALNEQLAQLKQNPKASQKIKAEVDKLTQALAAKESALRGIKDLAGAQSAKNDIENIKVRLAQLKTVVAALPTTPAVSMRPKPVTPAPATPAVSMRPKPVTPAPAAPIVSMRPKPVTSVPAAPIVSTTSKTSKVSKVSKVSKTSKTSKVSKVSKVSKTSKTSKVSKKKNKKGKKYGTRKGRNSRKKNLRRKRTGRKYRK